MKKISLLLIGLLLLTSCGILKNPGKEWRGKIRNQINDEVSFEDKLWYDDELQEINFIELDPDKQLGRLSFKDKEDIDYQIVYEINEDERIINVFEREGEELKYVATEDIIKYNIDSIAHPYGHLLFALDYVEDEEWETNMRADSQSFNLKGSRVMSLLQSIYRLDGSLEDYLPILSNELRNNLVVVELIHPKGKMEGFNLKFRHKGGDSYGVTYEYRQSNFKKIVHTKVNTESP